MNRFWSKINAYTMAELVIVMLIIAVVAGVSIKITKAKLDSVVSYTYYSAYNTLRSVAGEMMADSDSTDKYGGLSYNYKEKGLVDKFIDKYLIPKSYAASDGLLKLCPDGSMIPVSQNCPEETCDPFGIKRKECEEKGGLFTSFCTCQELLCPIFDIKNCENGGGTYNLQTCMCTPKSSCDDFERNMCLTEGGVWNDTACKCIMSSQSCDNVDEQAQCAAQHGVWLGYPSCTCDNNQCTLTQNDCSIKQVLDKDNCICRDKKTTLPKTGEEFCEAFVSYTNTTSYNCSGNNSASVSEAANSGNFADLAPDIVLRNGMKVYNVKNDYVKITALGGNLPIVYNIEANPLLIDSVFTAHSILREKFAYLFHNLLEQHAYALPVDLDSSQPDALDTEGLPPNLNDHGYIVYLDIDGNKGESVLYVDVFPFYITLSGRVVPAFRVGQEAGGNSTSHLTVSVQYDVYNSGDRHENWMHPKGTDFQHAACMSGYVTANTYCSGVNDAQLASKRAICLQTSSDCRLKVNKPLRF